MKDDALRIIKEVWQDKLKPLQPELYYPEGFSLPDDTVRFLKEYGLPLPSNDGIPVLEMEFFDDFPTNNFKSYQERNFFPIARDPFVPSIIVGIDYSNGQVFQLIGDGETADDFLCFVNSSVEAFVVCLGIYISEHLSLSEDMNIPIMQHANRLRKKFKNIDPKAVKKDDIFWSVILEQIEDELM